MAHVVEDACMNYACMTDGANSNFSVIQCVSVLQLVTSVAALVMAVLAHLQTQIFQIQTYVEETLDFITFLCISNLQTTYLSK